MADRPPRPVDPYHLDEGFERAVVLLACSSPRFHGRVGMHLDPACVALPASKLALEAAQAIGRERGRGPDKPVVVLQRLRQWVGEGRVAVHQVEAVGDLLEAALDAGAPEEDGVVSELSAVLKKRLGSDAVRAAIDDYGKGDLEFPRASRIMTKIASLGDARTDCGVKLGAGSFEVLESLRGAEKLPTGVLELDVALGGGMRRGDLLVYMGGPGSGKSMAMSHLGGHAVAHGLFVCEATLEVSVPELLARYKAFLTGVPIDAVLDDPRCVEKVLARRRLGPLLVQEFPAMATTVPDIEAWVEACEEQEGRRVDVLVIDYGDKLGSPKSAGREADSGYGVGRVVYERMRLYAAAANGGGHKGGPIFCVTGSQSSRRKDKKKTIDCDDVADSMHKVRVADLVISLNEDEAGLRWHVAKNRHGRSGVTVGPLPTDFALGRAAPVLPEDEAEVLDALEAVAPGLAEQERVVAAGERLGADRAEVRNLVRAQGRGA